MTKARTLADNFAADINAVTANAPLTGGGTSGTVTVGIQAGTTAQSGAVQLTDSTTSTSTTTAATPNSVKSAYDLADAAIAKSIVDAKADLITATADNTPARLAVGSNGDTLVADSSTTTGLRWQPNYSAGKNAVINGGFDIWQRGTSVSGAGGGAYTADRWYLFAGGQITVSRQLTNDSTNLPFIQYCARVQRNSGSTDTTGYSFSQPFETLNSVRFAGQTITFSFYARRGANYSAANNALGIFVVSGTGTDQNQQLGGYTGSNVLINNLTATLTTTWQRFTFTTTVPTNSTELQPIFVHIPVGTAGAADFFEVTGVQVEIGSVATPFTRNSATLAGELAACQRYYQVIAGYQAGGNAYSTTAAVFMRHFPVVMRTAPTPTYPGTLTSAIQNFSIGNATPTAVTTGNATTQAITFYATGATGLTAYNPTFWSGLDIALSSEL